MNEKKADHSPTTIGTYGLAIQKALEANGYDTRDIFAAAGIDHVPSNSPMERLTTAQVSALFRECVKLTGNPAVGLTVARFMHPSTLHALGYSLLASSSLRDCCERIVNYFRLASEQAEIRITETDDRYCISTHLLTDQLAFETLDAWNAFVVRLFRLIHHPDFAPVSVSLARPCPPGYEDQYLKGFHTRVTFDAPYCEICLDRAAVDEPLMGGNREIAHQNDLIIEEYLAALDQADIITRVKKIIIQSLPSGNCSKQRVASEMAMSPSALQQKLAERESSFQNLLSQVRQSLALAYMEQARVSITEMSFLLGFADTSSFTRAFRRWTGKSPRDYRRDLGLEH
ncbi:MAG: AraC family transcriptional regulator [Halioglobus sp.]